MKTIIMAAGMSQRLRPLTEEVPKTLLSLDEHRIIDHILMRCVNVGLTDFVVVTGHGHPSVVDYITEFEQKYPEVQHEVIYNDTYNDMGNIMSMRMAMDVIEEDFILINSDTIFHQDILQALVDSHHEHAMVVDNHKKLGEEEMKVLLDDEKRIVRIHKSLEPASSFGEYIGILKFGISLKNQLVQALDDTIAKDSSLYYEDGIQRMIDEFNVPIECVSTNGLPAMEIDTHEDLEEAKALITQM